MDTVEVHSKTWCEPHLVKSHRSGQWTQAEQVMGSVARLFLAQVDLKQVSALSPGLSLLYSSVVRIQQQPPCSW